MKKIFGLFTATFLLTFIALFLQSISYQILAQSSLNYYFGEEEKINPNVPTPEQVLGYQIGQIHVSHEHLVKYLYALSENSDRIQIVQYGHSYERRPLLLLTISSSENLTRIESIREDHIKLSDPLLSSGIEVDDMPVITWLGYSVHGNEPSGGNASLLTAYYLAASQSEEVSKILSSSVILMDPCVNPDGFNRYAEWVITNRSKNLSTDPNNREHREQGPGSRTNHYWFDLNRDLLLAQHPESQGRLQQFHHWKPNVFTDHHEMGSDNTFFFQPGIPSRNNPITPEENYKLTKAIARYHAQELDKIGSLYYSEESFDDFYYGKGSTYPDVNGCIGILFEQASSRSHARETSNGIIKFAFTVRNQFKTSLSTVKAGVDLRLDLLNHQKDFYRSALQEASNNPVKAWVFKFGNGDKRFKNFLEVLDRHQIEVFRFNGQVTTSNGSFSENDSYIVPLSQSQYRLINAIFESRTQFQDSLFYDVSTWTLPYAYDIDCSPLNDRQFKSLDVGGPAKVRTLEQKLVNKSEYGYLFKWDNYLSPKALYHLQDKGVRAKVSMKEFTMNRTQFGRGCVFIPVSIQSISSDSLFYLIQEIAPVLNYDIYPVSSSWTDSGIQLGSPNIINLDKPEIAVIMDWGVSSGEAGEVWHVLDQRYDIPITLLSILRVGSVDFNRYNTIVMVSGSYNRINENGKKKLKEWVENGGNIIAFKNATRWLNNQKITQIKFKSIKADTLLSDRAYGDLQRYRGAQNISGVILETKIDQSHPLNYGIKNDILPIFKNDKTLFEPSSNPYNRPVMITNNPLMSGYLSDKNLNILKGSSAVNVCKLGNGRIIAFSFNPNFRGYWYGTNRLFANALFFGDLISSQAAD
ncbi:M14 family zinc carboxypeptidase [Bacteroidota bacterium]